MILKLTNLGDMHDTVTSEEEGVVKLPEDKLTFFVCFSLQCVQSIFLLFIL